MKAKRFFSILLCVLMLTSLFPAGAFAADVREETAASVPAADSEPAPTAEPEPQPETAEPEAGGAPCTVVIFIDPALEAGTATVSPASGWYVGQEITLTARANNGYTFMWWVNYDTGENSKSSTYKTTLTGDCEWTAVFRKNGEYFIYVNKPYVEGDPSKTLKVSPEKPSYTAGTPITLTAPARSGRSVVYEYGKDVDGHSSSVTWQRLSGNTFSMPSYDVWVRGLYSVNLTLSVGAHGTASLSPSSGPYYEDDVVTLTVNPDSGYRVKGVSGVPSGATVSGNTVTFTVGENDATISVEFEELPSISLDVRIYPDDAAGSANLSMNETTGEVTLTATPKGGYHFLGWYDLGSQSFISQANPYTFKPTQNMTIFAYFYVNVIVNPNIEHGTLEIVGDPNENKPYKKGDVVTLLGHPDEGYVLDYYQAGELHGTGASLEPLEGDSFTMPANDMVVSAKFSKLHTISASASPNEGGTVTGAGQYKDGTSVTLTATANSGYSFVNWTENGTQVSTNATYSFTARADRSLVANFKSNTPVKYTISASANPTAGGSVSGAGQYEEGQTVTLTATANSGYRFVNWTENGTPVSTNATYSFAASADRTLVANFELIPVTKYTISASANPTEGGSVSGAGEYEGGQTVTLTATPNTGYRFVNWTENGSVVSTDATYSFTASANRTLVANFELIPAKYTISASANPTEGGSVSGAGEYEEGQTVTLTATTNSGYRFLNWTENGSVVSTNATYSFTASADRTLVANFEDISSITFYPVWVSGVQVTSENEDDVLGGGSGVTYDPGSQTLTFPENITLTGTYTDIFNRRTIIYAEQDLTIQAPEGLTVGGENDDGSYGIGIYGYSVTINTEKTLAIRVKHMGFDVSRGVTVNGNVDARCGNHCIASANGGVTVNGNVTLRSTDFYGVNVNSKVELNGNIDIEAKGFCILTNGDIALDYGTCTLTTTGNDYRAILGNNITLEGTSFTALTRAKTDCVLANQKLTLVRGEFSFTGVNRAILGCADVEIRSGVTRVYGKCNGTGYHVIEVYGGEIKLADNLAIIKPEGGYVNNTDYGRILDGNGNKATEVEIVQLQDPIPYVNAAGGDMEPVTRYTAVQADTTAWNTEWIVVTENVTVDGRITVTGNVNLILCDGATLTAAQGIRLTDGNSLTVWQQAEGSGALIATAPSYSAGIGGNPYEAGGSLTVNGGSITASTGDGTSGAAGIGGGRYAKGGTLIVNAGSVTASGGGWSAGIGGGGGSGNSGSTTNGGAGGTVIVNGGTVIANSGYRGAAIGGANGSGGGDVTINGGTVIASATSGAQAIGGGQRAGDNPGTLTLGVMKVYASSSAGEPVATEERIDTCRTNWAKITVCGEHHYEDGVCQWCGEADPDYTLYPLWIGGVQVNNERLSGDCDGGGSWSYEGDETGGTLTLTNAVITGIHEEYLSGNGNIYFCSATRAMDLTIVLVGANRLTNPDRAGIYFYPTQQDNSSLTVCGEGTLVIEAEHTGIRFPHTGVIDGAAVRIERAGEQAGWGLGAYDLTIRGGAEVIARSTVDGINCAGALTVENSLVVAEGSEAVRVFGGITLTGVAVVESTPEGGAVGSYTNDNGSTFYTVVADGAPATYAVIDAPRGAIPYVDAQGQDMEPIEKYLPVRDYTSTTWDKEWYVVDRDLTVDERITVSGNVNLILCDGATLTAKAGITVEGENSLTIWQQQGGTGKLFAGTTNGSDITAAENTAGIGSVSANAGAITVNGGVITARGGNERGAGIGSRQGCSCSIITINAGTVTAIGATHAAGLGNGPDNDDTGPGKVVINGGVVNASSINSGAGIGGCTNGTAAEVEINGGTVTANGGYLGAGIGGGANRPGTVVTINGGNVTANGGESGAGIGGGNNGAGGTITINGGTVNASGGWYGAGIGGGNNGAGGTITITDGTVNAGVRGWYSAGIGGGMYGAGGTVNISGGTVYAKGDEAGIGGGEQGAGADVTITGGTVTAVSGGYGYGEQAIGHGSSSDDPGTLSIPGMKAFDSSEATEPVAADLREDTCRSSWVKLTVCDPHDYSGTDACLWCGEDAPTYAITVDTAANGAVTADKNSTWAGDTVTLTVAPAEGYELDTLAVKQGETELATVKVDDTTYTFTMAAGAAAVSATFKGLPLTGTVTVSGTPTYGETLTAAYTPGNNTGELSYQWKRDGTPIEGATGAAYTLTGDDVGKVLSCEVTSSAQTGAIESDPTAAVAAAVLTVTAEAKTKTYGEADPALTYTAEGLLGSDTVTGELARAEGEDVGTYAITQGTLTAGENYTIRFTGAELTITAATGSAGEGEKPTAKEGLAFTGEAQELVTAPAKLPEGYDKVQYSTDGGATWTDTLPTGTEAGDYTVAVRYVGDKNHEDFTIAPIAVTIKAVWTVKFEMGGAAAVDDQKVVDGEKPAKPDDPVWDGYKFGGWYADKDLKTAFDFDAAITADTTVYAKWTAIPYVIAGISGVSAGSSRIWEKGSQTAIVITVKPEEGEDHSFDLFRGVEIDGKALTEGTDFEARKGSTVVSIKPAALQKLALGVHKISILFENGTAEISITVRNPSGSAKTGDDSRLWLWLSLLTVSGLGLGAVLLPRKRRGEN